MTGAGAAGILPVSMVLVLELTGKKRRGLYIGLVNTGYTFGVALGAVIAGALEPIIGWVCAPLFQVPRFMLSRVISSYLLARRVLDPNSHCFHLGDVSIL